MADELYGGHGNPMPAFQFNGEQGRGRLDAALALMASPYYEGAAEAASATFYAIIKNHPFRDGNKRFSIVATQMSLMINGYCAFVSPDEWEILALDVARNELGQAEVFLYFSDRVLDVVRADASVLERLASQTGVEAVAEVALVLNVARRKFDEALS
jgi:death-on-curing protein